MLWRSSWWWVKFVFVTGTWVYCHIYSIFGSAQRSTFGHTVLKQMCCLCKMMYCTHKLVSLKSKIPFTDSSDHAYWHCKLLRCGIAKIHARLNSIQIALAQLAHQFHMNQFCVIHVVYFHFHTHMCSWCSSNRNRFDLFLYQGRLLECIQIGSVESGSYCSLRWRWHSLAEHRHCDFSVYSVRIA